MPIYEYRCAACHQKSTFFPRSVGEPVEAVCQGCGGGDMRRLISPVAIKVSAGPAPEMEYYRDPSNIGRHVEESFKRFGLDMPESVSKTIQEARKGKLPEGLEL